MDRSLKWRTFALVGLILLCVGILLPSVTDDESRPSWFPFQRKINLGLDLRGGLHIVYSIDLNTAIVDRGSEIARDLMTRFKEGGTEGEAKIDVTVKTPLSPPGAVTVIPADPNKRADIEAAVKAEYKDTVEERPCEDDVGPGAYCFKVADSYAEGIKKSALEHAVTTIRERIDEKGVAEPSVVQKDDQIIVELPGLDKEDTAETRNLIARTAKLEFKVVDDGSKPGQAGSNGSDFMREIWNETGWMSKSQAMAVDKEEGDPTNELAVKLGVKVDQDRWKPEEGDGVHYDYFLKAEDKPGQKRSIDEAIKLGCLKKSDKERIRKAVDGMVDCDIKGWQLIQQYLEALAAKDPKFKVPDDHQIGYEYEEPENTKFKPFWRSYYLVREVRLTGTSIVKAQGSFEPSSGRPVVLLDFNRHGAHVFGDLTSQIVGQKLATILDDKVKSAPIINGAIRGGHASITMGGADPDRQLKERDDLVNVLRTGSLPAPLREESSSVVGPTLGRDAIDKTKLSFILGVILVILIMVGIYKWSGWISVFAVVFHNILTISVMAVFGATLTLPGIAAVVLAVGMTVDGNILIYERIRDELQLGKSVRGAVDLGFTRAFSAILDGQLTTAAAGWVLLNYGSGPIKGFATMLLVGVFTTIVTNIWVTRIFFDWYIARKKGQLATISI